MYRVCCRLTCLQEFSAYPLETPELRLGSQAGVFLKSHFSRWLPDCHSGFGVIGRFAVALIRRTKQDIGGTANDSAVAVQNVRADYRANVLVAQQSLNNSNSFAVSEKAVSQARN